MLINTLSIIRHWLAYHRKKYIISWLSFASIFVFVTFLMAFDDSATKKYSEHNLEVKILSFGSGTLSNIIGESNGAFIEKDDLSFLYVDDITQLSEEIDMVGYRCLSEQSIRSIVLPNGVEYTPLLRCYNYWSSNGILLLPEESGTEVKEAVDTVYVTKEFISLFCKYSPTFNMNEMYMYIDDNGVAYISSDSGSGKYKKVQIIEANKNTALNNAMIYYPSSKEAIGVLDKVDIELSSSLKYEETKNYLLSKGIHLAIRNDGIELSEETKNRFEIIGRSVGIVLLIFATASLLNINFEMIESNKQFFELLYYIGCRKSFYKLFVFSMSIIPGMIGGLIGTMITFLGKPFFNKLTDYVIGDYRNYFSYSYSITHTALLKAFIFCVMVVVVGGFFSCITISRSITGRESASVRKLNNPLAFLNYKVILLTLLIMVSAYGIEKVTSVFIDARISSILCSWWIIGGCYFLHIRTVKISNTHQTAASVKKHMVIYSLVCVISLLGFIVLHICKDIATDISKILSSSYLAVTQEAEWQDIWLSVLAYGIWSAIAEELLFRGYVLRKVIPSKKTASIVCTSVLFAIFHFSIDTFIPVFILSLFLSYLYQKTEKLGYCILGHISWNIAALLFANVGKSIIGPSSFKYEATSFLLKLDVFRCLIVMLPLTFCLFFVLMKLKKVLTYDEIKQGK